MDLLKQLASDENIFTNKNFFEKLSTFNEDEIKLLYVYKINFEKIKSHLDQFINSILDNSSTIPYLLKCICKIIHVLISKKVR